MAHIQIYLGSQYQSFIRRSAGCELIQGNSLRKEWGTIFMNQAYISIFTLSSLNKIETSLKYCSLSDILLNFTESLIIQFKLKSVEICCVLEFLLSENKPIISNPLNLVLLFNICLALLHVPDIIMMARH